jgi:hypothetical protein
LRLLDVWGFWVEVHGIDMRPLAGLA